MDNRVKQLQNKLQLAGVDIWLQPVADEFQGEYPADYAKRLHYLTGFSGSAGLGAFCASGARHALFVDGRYTIQAAQEVDNAIIEVMPPHQKLADWLAGQRPMAGDALRVGFDGWLHSRRDIVSMRESLSEKAGITFEPYANWVDAIWENQPPMPAHPIILHDVTYTGMQSGEKITQLWERIQSHGASSLWTTLPDGIAWLLNIRGADIHFNPLALAYARVDAATKDITLFMQPRVQDDALQAHFKALNVRCEPIESLWRQEASLSDAGDTVLLDSGAVPYNLWEMVQKAGAKIVDVRDPITMMKAIKNDTELAQIQQAHRYDGAALSNVFAALEAEKQAFDELSIMRKVEAARAAQPGYQGASFATIAGTGEHGAIVHYHADEKSNRTWQEGELLLLDSGGQYWGGTTDVTRTLARGETMKMDAEIKDRYTRVLKGHIAIAQARFPEGTTGAQIDALARQFLWQIGCDYDHGTGHGVGAYLCVHEGPQSISKRSNQVALQPGMVLSNEPGYYKTGAYGIRIENLVVVKSLGESEDGRNMLGFDTITLVPIATNLLNMNLLTAEEIDWLNGYHDKVLKALEPLVEAGTKAWLQRACVAV